MSTPTLKLIRGGLSSAPSDNRILLNAYVTDTRLMGVICMYLHWSMPGGAEDSHLHQFFYFEAEESGFDDYQSVHGNDLDIVSVIEQTLSGGLGGKQIDINEREAAAILQEYVKFNRKHSIPLPGEQSEYSFLMSMDPQLTPEEMRTLARKQCCRIVSDYQAINYFLMRVFGHDYKAAEFLMGRPFDTKIWKKFPIATLYRNEIEDVSLASDPGSLSKYYSTSLVEFNEKYFLLTSELWVRNHQVVDFSKRAEMRISNIEASMMLTRPEFVTSYEILTNPEHFDAGMMELSLNSTIASYPNGKIYMIFNSHNNHVNSRIFNLNDDLYGLYYVTDFGQLIVGAYSLENIHSLEKDLRASLLSKYIVPVSKYEFKDPVLLDFAQSDFVDFEEFLAFITRE